MAATPKKGAAAKPAAKPAPAPKKEAAAAGDLKARFEAAAAAAKQGKRRPDNATMLKLYSYYKQATEGDVRGDRPGGFDFVGAAKYDAWAKLKGVSRDDAMTTYIKQVERLNRE
jgi:acyl-CoA-binding protein